MALVPVTNTPGLWQAPHWTPETPGVYAVIVGVSNYPHLQGGSAQAGETFDLGQLEVSARTAAAVFEWLCSDYQHADLPVVWCYLLLSPSEGEKAFLRDKNITHYETPTDGRLRDALQLWCSSLPAQSPSAGRSRTLFFFSGHGVQSNWDPLLLPSDYLSPPNVKPILERCMSTKEMTEWMETHPVGEHLAFFDACRNEFSPLAAKGSTANRVFPRNPPGPTPRVVATLSATAPNSVAYQSAGADDYTFFGKALIEGLDGAGGKKPVHRAGALDIEFLDLVKYVKPRVMQLLQTHDTTLEQTAKPFLDPCDVGLIVTQIPAEGPLPTLSLTRGMAEAPVPPHGPAADTWAMDAEKMQDSHFNIDFHDLGGVPVAAFRDFSFAHGFFGHEYASCVWGDFRLMALSDGRPLDAHAMPVRRVTRDSGSMIVRVDLELGPMKGGVLAAFGGVSRGLLALVLPTEEEIPVPIRLTLTFGHPHHGLVRVEGQLGPSGMPYYGPLWNLSRIANFASFADAAKEAGRINWEELKEVVKYKRMASTAAVAAAIILAHGGRIRMIEDWTRNLMNWFPDIPDGAVLWAESLRAAMASGERKPFGVSDPLGEMALSLGTLEGRGIPFFVDAIDLLDRQLRYLGSLSGELASSLHAVRCMTDRVFQVASPSGQFLMLAALPRPGDPERRDVPLSMEELAAILRPEMARQGATIRNAGDNP